MANVVVTPKGTSGNDTLFGGTGADNIYAGAGDDVVYGNEGNDSLRGDAGADTLFGGLGDDFLDGGVGADRMDGGVGNDTYVVDDAGDVVVEGAGGGTDLVKASVSYRLSDWVENLTLIGAGALSGTGNGLANTIKGNDGANRLEGLGGADSLDGGTGDDVLVGGAGSDTLRGGAGADRFVFGARDETAGTASDAVSDLNFAEGDRLVFTGYGAGEATIASYADLAAFVATTPGARVTKRDSAGVAQIALTSGSVIQFVNLTDKSGAGSAWAQYQTALAANKAPVAVADVAQTGQQASALIDVLVNDRDDAPGLTLVSATRVSGAGSVVVENGKVRFDTGDAFRHLAAGQPEAVAIDYTVRDAAGLTATARLTVTVTGSNDAPVIAGAVSGAVPEDGATLALDALGRASDIDDGTQLAVVGVPVDLPAGVSYDTVTHRFTLDPAHTAYQALTEGAIRVVTVAYGVSDGVATTPASVSWTVTGTNDAPVVKAAIADQSVAEDSAWSFTVPAGTFADVDSASLTLSATMTDGTALPGWLAFDAATGTFSGTPPLDYNGVLSLSVTAGDGALGGSDDFTLTVRPVNDLPVAVADRVAAIEDQVITVAVADLLANDGDPDGDAPTLFTVTSLRDLTFQGVEDGKLIFTTAPDFSGPASFTYGIRDAQGVTSFAAVTVDVAAVEDAPIVVAPIAGQTMTEDTAWSFAVPAGTFADRDGDALTLSATLGGGAALPGWLAFDAATGTFSGAPPQNYNGAIDLTVTASDGIRSVSQTFGLMVAPVNDAPVANPDRIEAIEDRIITVTVADLLKNDGDVDGDDPSLFTVAGLQNLAFQGLSDGILTFTTAPNFNGAAGFTYGINDGHGGTSFAAVAVDVAPVADSPRVVAPIADQRVAEDTFWDFTVPAGTFADADGDTLTLSATKGSGAPLPSWLTFDGATGRFSGTPPFNYHGTLDIEVLAGDGVYGAGYIFTLTVTPVNDAPFMVASIPDRVTDEDQQWSYTVSSEFFGDNDGDALTLSATRAGGAALPSWLSFDAGTSRFSGTPPLNFNGLIDLRVIASDGTLSVSDDFRLTIRPQSDPTLLLAPVADRVMDEDGKLSWSIAANFADGDTNNNNRLDYSAKLANGNPLPSWLQLDGKSGEFKVDGTKDAFGRYDIAVTARDSSDGSSASDTFVLTVNSVNDAPVARADTLNMLEDGGNLTHFFSGTALTGNDSDADREALTIVGFSNQTHGTVRNSFGAGSYWFDLEPNFSGTAGFDYTLRDASGATSTAHVTVNVAAVNDAPVAVADTIYMNNNAVLTLPANAFMGNDYDIDSGQPSFVDWTDNDPNITVSWQYPGSILQIAPKAGFYGLANFTYRATDNQGGYASAQVPVDVNGAPVTMNDFATIGEDEQLTIRPAALLANDRDPEGGKLTLVSVGNAYNGRVHINDNRGEDSDYVVFYGDQNFFGLAQFDYVARDVRGAETTGRVTVAVVPTKDYYRAVTDNIGGSADKAGYYVDEFPELLLANDRNPDGNPFELEYGVNYPYSLYDASNITHYWVDTNGDGDDDRVLIKLTDPSKMGYFEYRVLTENYFGTGYTNGSVYFHPWKVDDISEFGETEDEMRSFASHDTFAFARQDHGALVMAAPDTVLL